MKLSVAQPVRPRLYKLSRQPARILNGASKRINADLEQAEQNSEKVNEWLADRIDAGKPFVCTRLGSVELHVIRRIQLSRRFGGPSRLPKHLLYEMYNNAGVYPQIATAAEQMVDVYLNDLPMADLVGVWGNIGEKKILDTYSSQARRVSLGTLEPFFVANSWTSQLAGKTVLVVNPFVLSIARQFERRELVHKGPYRLPAFDLRTLRSVQSAAGSVPPHATWLESLCRQKDAMATIEFDVAIVGAGAYGLPLAVHAKRLGKIAIHLGGMVQMIFGVSGERWRNRAGCYADLMSPDWVSPDESERPQGFASVESGCYW